MWIESHFYDGSIGRDWMPYIMKMDLLCLNGFAKIATADMRCYCYMTQAYRFSTGYKALEKWVQIQNVHRFEDKKSLLEKVDPHKYIPFDSWLKNQTKVKPFSADNTYSYNNIKRFSLSFTNSMLNNIHRKMSCAQGNLWIDNSTWELIENEEAQNDRENAGRVDPSTGLPREVWTS